MFISKCCKATFNEVVSPVDPDREILICSVCGKPATGNAINEAEINRPPTEIEKAAIRKLDFERAQNHIFIDRDWKVYDREEGRDDALVGEGDSREMAQAIAEIYLQNAIVKHGIKFFDDVDDKDLTDEQWFEKKHGRKPDDWEKENLERLRKLG